MIGILLIINTLLLVILALQRRIKVSVLRGIEKKIIEVDTKLDGILDPEALKQLAAKLRQSTDALEAAVQTQTPKTTRNAKKESRASNRRV